MKRFLILSVIFLVMGCSNSAENIQSDSEEKTTTYSSVSDTTMEETIEKEDFDMSNPAFMMGTNVGVLFNTYFKIGDFDKMLTYTDSATIRKFGRENLKKYYRKADLGMEMKLKNMTSEENKKILHYELIINATKIIKRLHVVVENDTARVVPQHPEFGKIFE